MFSVVYTTHGPPMLNYVRNVPKHQVFACPWAVQKLFMPYSEKFFLYGARDYCQKLHVKKCGCKIR